MHPFVKVIEFIVCCQLIFSLVVLSRRLNCQQAASDGRWVTELDIVVSERRLVPGGGHMYRHCSALLELLWRWTVGQPTVSSVDSEQYCGDTLTG